MNLPNKLTLLRIFMIPLFLIFFFGSMAHNYLWAFLTFVLAALTDMLDGMLARKWGQLTDFGKLMDPLADKLLTITAFICLLSAWDDHLRVAGLLCLIIIISREFAVTSIRLVAAEKGIIIAADKWGKLKTVAQMLWICQVLLRISLTGYLFGFGAEIGVQIIGIWAIFDFVLLAIMMLLTVGSGINYIVKNRHLIKQS
jgi:CDP-diacylglycerol--glycerol-3-phosphate 3-phosphatidyltransferase